MIQYSLNKNKTAAGGRRQQPAALANSSSHFISPHLTDQMPRGYFL
tara:strand:- start:361 stop:498 length:138 start_codon:yes stop_codon:yes gene_type:complete